MFLSAYLQPVLLGGAVRVLVVIAGYEYYIRRLNYDFIIRQ